MTARPLIINSILAQTALIGSIAILVLLGAVEYLASYHRTGPHLRLHRWLPSSLDRQKRHYAAHLNEPELIPLGMRGRNVSKSPSAVNELMTQNIALACPPAMQQEHQCNQCLTLVLITYFDDLARAMMLVSSLVVNLPRQYVHQFIVIAPYEETRVLQQLFSLTTTSNQHGPTTVKSTPIRALSESDILQVPGWSESAVAGIYGTVTIPCKSVVIKNSQRTSSA